MANIDSSSVSFPANNWRPADFLGIDHLIDVLKKEANELRLPKAVIRITVTLEAKNFTARVYFLLLTRLIKNYTGSPTCVGPEHSFDFSSDGTFIWKGEPIYLTYKERVVLFKALVLHETMEGEELISANQAIYRLRARYGKDFPGLR